MGEETIICPTCQTEHVEGTVQCFNCGRDLSAEVAAPSSPEQSESNEPQDQQEESQPETTGEVAGETAEGEEVKPEGAVEKLKNIFSRGEKIEVKDESAGEEKVEVKTGEMSSEPQSTQEQE